MKKLLGILLGVMMLFSVAGTSSALMIDQSNLDPAETWGAITNEITWGQEVTSQVDGYLNNLEIFFTDDDQTPEPEMITGEVLVNDVVVGTSVMLYDDIGASSLVFDFSAFNIFLGAGDAWNIHMTGSDDSWNYGLDLSADTYAGGGLNAIVSGNSYDYSVYDMRFIETIDDETAPVPEPATMLLLCTGLVAVAGFGRKKFRK